MANSFTNYAPKWLAMAQDVLRKNCWFLRLVNTDFSMAAAEKGSTINVPIPSDYTTVDITPGVTSQANADTSPTNVSVALSNWRGVKFHITDKEACEIEAGQSFIPRGLEAAAKSVTEDLNSKLWAQYDTVHGYVGAINGTITEPFASDVSAATDARKILTTQACPRGDRRLILDPDAYANALKLAAFSSVQQSGESAPLIQGDVGTKFGFGVYEDQQVPTHTAGTLSDGTNHKALINGAVSAGATTMSIDSTTLTGTVVTGDIFQVAGNAQTYVVNGGPYTASGNAIANITFTPASLGFADNAVISFANSHVVNLAFHRDAFALAARPLVGNVGALFAALGGAGGSLLAMETMADPLTGFPLRLSVIREYMQTAIVLDCLYGVEMLRAEKAVRVAGLP